LFSFWVPETKGLSLEDLSENVTLNGDKDKDQDQDQDQKFQSIVTPTTQSIA
jgi:hypothetical protein